MTDPDSPIPNYTPPPGYSPGDTRGLPIADPSLARRRRRRWGFAEALMLACLLGMVALTALAFHVASGRDS